MSKEEIIILGKRYIIDAGGYIRGLDKCPRCDAEGLVYVYIKHGDYYHDACGLHVGSLNDECSGCGAIPHRPNTECKGSNVNSTLRFTVEPGRCIYRDGKRYIAIAREVDKNGNCQVTPVDVDNLTHEICAFLNAREPKK